MSDNINFMWIKGRVPDAKADIRGSKKYPDINGTAYFFQTNAGVMVVSEIRGLPYYDENCGGKVFAYHIHSGESCSGNENDYFADAMTHYNPYGCAHPYHAGDMPPLFGCGKIAFSAFLTDRFYVKDILGKTVIIHSEPDDFTTQPSGNSGEKIACGVIKSLR